MLRDLQKPIIYLITNGATTSSTTPDSDAYSRILKQIEAAVAAEVSLIQIREKLLSARVLFELTNSAVGIVKHSSTRLLINDRADIAAGAGADGVHLTSKSVPADAIRQTYGPGFTIGVSTHCPGEVKAAVACGADFCLFGPVFDTESKRAFGEPQGLDKLAEVSRAAGEFPVVAIGGITMENVSDCFRAGAAGVAAIRLFAEVEHLRSIVEEVRYRASAIDE